MLDFLGIGAQKCGTTWLYRNLARHPMIGFPAGKEVHYWDSPAGRSIGWYASQFPDHPAGVVQGEITPAYAILPRTIVQSVHDFAPSARLVFSIRNPIDRAWSSALMALGRAEMSVEEASDRWFLDHFRSAGSVLRGDYQACLECWLSVFPMEQMLVCRFDDIANRPRQLLERVTQHVGVDPKAYLDSSFASIRSPVFAGPGIALRPTLRGHLRDFYGPKIASLGRFLGWDLNDWTR